jgi:prepilin signal peptidase PulO-like enzyme (type II secretory pathway)
MLSATVPDRFVRPVIAFAILASGLKYVGLSTTALGWALCGVLLGAGTLWMTLTQPWHSRTRALARGDQQP